MRRSNDDCEVDDDDEDDDNNDDAHDDGDCRYAPASTLPIASQQMVHALVPPAGLACFAKNHAEREG